MEPLWKAVGGKRKHAAKLAKLIMACKPQRYVEPFVGAGAVALALPAELPKIIADTNRAFVAIWRSLKERPEILYQVLRDWYSIWPDEDLKAFRGARDALNVRLRGLNQPGAEYDNLVDLAALALHVVARSFNGMWRLNRAGMFNVPWNKSLNPRRYTQDELLACSAALEHVEIHPTDFRVTLNLLGKDLKGTVIYGDPPYDGTFTGYTSDKFDEQDQRDLAVWLHYMADRGADVFATNADTPLVREIYSWAQIDALEEWHHVGATGARRGKRGCVLIRSRK